MFVPAEVLDKRTQLDLHEWNSMKRHPIYGARYLSTLHDVPKLAIIVAFEHHIKFDGSGYPDPGHGGKGQHPISQMVALSDFFDALRTERPYRKPVEVGSIVNLLKEGAGKDFNPFLVDNFIGALRAINAL
jgi:response regulator RpfG family c-di-GMP phosphodiesterase